MRRVVVDRSSASVVVPVEPVVVTTARAPGTAPDKPARLRSSTWLELVRRESCERCGAPGPSDPHHAIVRGGRDDTYDLTAVPLCRRCHDELHTLPMPREERERLTNELLGSFLRRALLRLTRSVARTVCDEMRAGLEGT